MSQKKKGCSTYIPPCQAQKQPPLTVGTVEEDGVYHKERERERKERERERKERERERKEVEVKNGMMPAAIM